MNALRALPMAPLTRDECREWEECALKSCRYNLLAFDQQENYQNRLHHAEQLARRSGEHCALTVADRGEHTQMEISLLLGTTRARVGQIEQKAISKLVLAGQSVPEIIEWLETITARRVR